LKSRTVTSNDERGLVTFGNYEFDAQERNILTPYDLNDKTALSGLFTALSILNLEPYIAMEDHYSRYDRQMLISGWGDHGQEKLRSATVFIAGAGGLGCPAALYLTAAGVGKIKICDFGRVETTNLNRQILYSEKDLQREKVVCAAKALSGLNPEVTVEALFQEITDENIRNLVGDSTLIIDCLDNFKTRHILNRFAVLNRIPMIHAGIESFSGQITFIHPPETPCLHCIFPGDIPPKNIFPVAGVTPGIIGALEAAEAVKWIVGIGSTLKGRLLVWDGESMDFQKIEIKKDPACTVCSR